MTNSSALLFSAPSGSGADRIQAAACPVDGHFRWIVAIDARRSK
jgi:hypothetical protein